MVTGMVSNDQPFAFHGAQSLGAKGDRLAAPEAVELSNRVSLT
jgi:hypothetical protein